MTFEPSGRYGAKDCRAGTLHADGKPRSVLRDILVCGVDAPGPRAGELRRHNAFIDGLAHRRHALSVPALSVNWGVVSGHCRPHRMRPDAWRIGIMSLTPAEGVDALGRLHEQAQLAVIRLSRNAGSRRIRGRDRPFSPSCLQSVVSRDAGQPDPCRPARDRTRPRLGLFESHLREQLAHVRASSAQVDRLAPLKTWAWIH